MRQLGKIIFLLVFLIFGVGLEPTSVQAETYANWICWEERCDPGEPPCDEYAGFYQICTCDPDLNCDPETGDPSDCTQCSPGYYVCNTGCCPIDPVSCFPAGTQVLLSDGSTKGIEEVVVGDEVVSQDEAGGRSTSQVVEVETPVRSQMCEVSFTDGEVLQLTDEHPLLTTLGWRAIEPEHAVLEVPSLAVSTLEAGDEVITTIGTSRVERIGCFSQQNQTYNLVLC